MKLQKTVLLLLILQTVVSVDECWADIIRKDAIETQTFQITLKEPSQLVMPDEAILIHQVQGMHIAAPFSGKDYFGYGSQHYSILGHSVYVFVIENINHPNFQTIYKAKGKCVRKTQLLQNKEQFSYVKTVIIGRKRAYALHQITIGKMKRDFTQDYLETETGKAENLETQSIYKFANVERNQKIINVIFTTVEPYSVSEKSLEKIVYLAKKVTKQDKCGGEPIGRAERKELKQEETMKTQQTAKKEEAKQEVKKEEVKKDEAKQGNAKHETKKQEARKEDVKVGEHEIKKREMQEQKDQAKRKGFAPIVNEESSSSSDDEDDDDLTCGLVSEDSLYQATHDLTDFKIECTKSLCTYDVDQTPLIKKIAYFESGKTKKFLDRPKYGVLIAAAEGQGQHYASVTLQLVNKDRNLIKDFDFHKGIYNGAVQQLKLIGGPRSGGDQLSFYSVMIIEPALKGVSREFRNTGPELYDLLEKIEGAGAVYLFLLISDDSAKDVFDDVVSVIEAAKTAESVKLDCTLRTYPKETQVSVNRQNPKIFKTNDHRETI